MGAQRRHSIGFKTSPADGDERVPSKIPVELNPCFCPGSLAIRQAVPTLYAWVSGNHREKQSGKCVAPTQMPVGAAPDRVGAAKISFWVLTLADGLLSPAETCLVVKVVFGK